MKLCDNEWSDQRRRETLGQRMRIHLQGTTRYPEDDVFHMVFSLLGAGIAAGSGIVGYWQARSFTQNKLRYVDAVHKASVPIVAGVGALAIATPVVWLLPIVGGGTALLFGGGVAMGVAAGARDIRKRLGAG
jgi:hypothetical protein